MKMTKVFKIQNIYAIKGIVKNNETTKVCAHKWHTYGKSTKKQCFWVKNIDFF